RSRRISWRNRFRSTPSSLFRTRCRSGGCSETSCSTCCRSSPARSISAPYSSRPTKFLAACISPISPAPGCADLLSCWRWIFPPPPESLLLVPRTLWFGGSLLCFAALPTRRGMAWLSVMAVASVVGHFALPPLLDIPKLAVSDYKGVSYARKFPDGRRVYERS